MASGVDDRAPAPDCRARVLLVDDDDQFRGFLRAALIEAGYEVSEAADGEEAAFVFGHSDPPPDAVVTNLMMPNKEGLALIGELRDANPKLPMVAMTGHAGRFGDRYLRAASTLGADVTLRKPFEVGELLGALRRLGAGVRIAR